MNKIELMKKISTSFSLYEASKWLSKSRAELNGKTPANFIKQNKIQEVHTLLAQDTQKDEGH